MAITHAQGAGSFSSSVSITPHATGNLLVVCALSSGQTMSISDTAGNTWNVGVAQFNASGAGTACWYAYSKGTASTTITVSASGSSFLSVVVDEFSGTALASPIDQHQTESGTTTYTPISITPDVDNALLYSYFAANGTISVGAGFSQGATDNNGDITAYKILGTGTSGVAQSVPFSYSGSQFNVVALVIKPTANAYTKTLTGSSQCFGSSSRETVKTQLGSTYIASPRASKDIVKTIASSLAQSVSSLTRFVGRLISCTRQVPESSLRRQTVQQTTAESYPFSGFANRSTNHQTASETSTVVVSANKLTSHQTSAETSPVSATSSRSTLRHFLTQTLPVSASLIYQQIHVHVVEIIASMSTVSRSLARSISHVLSSSQHLSSTQSKQITRSINARAWATFADTTRSSSQSLGASIAKLASGLSRSIKHTIPASQAHATTFTTNQTSRSTSAMSSSPSVSMQRQTIISRIATTAQNSAVYSRALSLLRDVVANLLSFASTTSKNININASASISPRSAHLGRQIESQTSSSSMSMSAQTGRSYPLMISAVMSLWQATIMAVKRLAPVALRQFAVASQRRDWSVETATRYWTVDVETRTWRVTDEEMIYTTKDPQATEDFVLDWTQELNGDSITSSSWTVPTGLTLGTSSFGSTSATGRLSGGSLGRTYTIANVVTLASGQIKSRSLTITIEVA